MLQAVVYVPCAPPFANRKPDTSWNEDALRIKSQLQQDTKMTGDRTTIDAKG